jgi:hypothetical protein
MTNSTYRGRREFLKAGAAIVCAAGGWSQTLGAVSRQDRPTSHGMLLVGQHTAFLSHLPLFASPHDYQVILEVTFAKAGGDPQADYFNDRKRSGTKIYTIEPDRFVLPQLNAATPLRSFTTNIYRGHFERFPNERAKEAARIGEAVTATVTRVIHFRKFDPAQAKSPHLEYLLFGKGPEILAAHVITGAPDFDQVLAVTATAQKFTDAQLAQGVMLRLADRKNVVDGRIRGTKPVSAEIAGAAGTAATKVQLQPGIEFYFDRDELSS